ncbi:hypothetical protein PROPHICCUG48898T2_36 [Mycobacterium phage CCUG48898T-2]|nr:hypothetical protein MMCCUG48898_1652 [Mycobacteroides abscessus subsp. massiliense CCUG 48898 = JCM 15300]WJJ56449.1 hypothetical protein PROPHICCUG48898T2_36 [Mycobacterium phage CCUG48898T-2]
MDALFIAALVAKPGTTGRCSPLVLRLSQHSRQVEDERDESTPKNP